MHIYTELSENPPPDLAAETGDALRTRLCSMVVFISTDGGVGWVGKGWGGRGGGGVKQFWE